MTRKRKHYTTVKRTSVVLSEDVHAKLKAMSTSTRSMSDIIVHAINEYLRKEKRNQEPKPTS